VIILSNLQKIRLEKGLSIRELAVKSGVTASAISRLETVEGRKATRLTVYKLEKALELPEGTLVDLLDTGLSERARKRAFEQHAKKEDHQKMLNPLVA